MERIQPIENPEHVAREGKMESSSSSAGNKSSHKSIATRVMFPMIVTQRSCQGYDDMKRCLEIVTQRSSNKGEIPKGYCINCLAYCSLFPKGYEIEGDELIQLWIVAGVCQTDHPLKYGYGYGYGYLRALVDFGDGFISYLREDGISGRKWYKFNDLTLSESALGRSRLSFAKVDNHNFNDAVGLGNSILSTLGKYYEFHVSFQTLPSNFDFVHRFEGMRTLLLLRVNGHHGGPYSSSHSHINHLPYAFFTSLTNLQTLDLSGTQVSQLPASVHIASSLRYLNLSNTPITRLPETISRLPYLQTLKLRNCPRLLALPNTTNKLISLRHLDLGTLCHLRSMPPGLRALNKLQTLSNFVVGRGVGCSIGELNPLSCLRLRICLSRLENVESKDQAMSALLHEKEHITMLELRWTADLDWENIHGNDCPQQEEQENVKEAPKHIIEHLRPSTNLQNLRILCYGGSELPTWISNPSFDKLVHITLFKCENWLILPSLGLLPSLETLSLIELVQVKIIDLNFCIQTDTDYGDNFVAFPKLQRLEIKSMLNLEEWRDIGKEHYFPCLAKLVAKDCPRLTSLCTLANMSSLEYLEINHCDKLLSLPKGGLPASIKTFVIEECPLLSSSCRSSLENNKDLHTTEDTSSLLIYQRDD